MDIMESRKNFKKPGQRLTPSAALPLDFTRSVEEVFSNNFDEVIKKLEKESQDQVRFKAQGQIYQDEIVLGISLLFEKRIPATTAYCSIDFDPKASSPKAEDLLTIAVDALGSTFDQFLNNKDPQVLEQLISGTLASMENIPFEWTPIDFEKKKIWLKVDKTNPALEQMTDEWLSKHDPKYYEEEDELEEESKKLFITGEQNEPYDPNDSGNLH